MGELQLAGVIGVVLLVVLATGVPVAFGLGFTALVFLFWRDGWLGVEFTTETIFSGLNDFTLVSIPMFILMGRPSPRAGPAAISTRRWRVGLRAYRAISSSPTSVPARCSRR